MYHVPLAVQCIYGWSDEGGENGDGKEGRELLEDGGVSKGWERAEITWPLVCR